jgi:hypothetical protein
LIRRRSGGAWAWFHGVWTCGAKVLEHRIISSLKTKLNQIVAENFKGIGMCLWWCCWKDLDEQDLFGFRPWEILTLK